MNSKHKRRELTLEEKQAVSHFNELISLVFQFYTVYSTKNED